MQNGIVNMVLFDWMESDASAKAAYEKGESLIALWNDEYKASAVTKTKSLAIEHIDKCYNCLDDIESKLKEANSSSFDSFIEGRKLLENVLVFLKNRQI